MTFPTFDRFSVNFRLIRISLLFFWAASGLLMAQTPPPFEVNTPEDVGDHNPGDGFCRISEDPDSPCSLRAAIEESNSNPDWNTITLPALQYSEPYVLTEGPLNISTNTTINGEDARTVIIDANRERGFYITGSTGFNVWISNLAIRNGFYTEPGLGGGEGGAMLIGPNANVLLFRVRLEDNEAEWKAAAIYTYASSYVSLTECLVTGNIIPMSDGSGDRGRGGAIVNNGTLNIRRSTFSNNRGTQGGAIENRGQLEIINSTFSGNLASINGGAINNEIGNLSISFSTFTENEVHATPPRASKPFIPPNTGGGAISNINGQVSVGNSIIAGNTDHSSSTSASPDVWSIDHEDKTPTFTSYRGNLFGTVNPAVWNVADATWGDLRFDQIDIDDPQLGRGPYYYGGETPVHQVLAGSPALENGTGTTSASFFDCPETDQRGVPRPPHGGGPNGERCDVGAFELTAQTEFMEAEDAEFFGDYFQISWDPTASGNESVYAPSDLPNSINAPDENQRLEFDVFIKTGGDFNIVGWARAFSPDYNSFWVRIDDQPGDAYLWDLQGNGSDFLPEFISDRGDGNEGNPEIDPVEVYLSQGMHTITVYPRENNTFLDRIQMVPVPTEVQMLELETSAYITGDFSVVNDPAAKNSQYVILPASEPDITDGPNDAHKIVQNITVDEAGTYLIRSHVWAEFDSKNSFYMKVDGFPEEGYLWDMTENNFSFGLDYVSDRGNGSTGNPEQDPVEIYLSEGEHIIEVFAREAGTGIDNIGLELKSNADAKIISRNKPAYSSSNENGNLTPDNAVDGNFNTRWSSQFSEPQWIQIDLQGTYDVHRVVLDWQNSHGVEYKIQISDDAQNWTTLYHKTGGDGGTDNLIVNGKGRYIRMKGIDRSTQYGFSLWEFDVYGTSADSSGGFVCEGDCLNAEPIVKDEIKVLNTTGDKWYVVNDNINGWQASEMAGRSIFVNGVQVQPGQMPLPAKVNGKYYFHFTAGQHPWASWSFWNW